MKLSDEQAEQLSQLQLDLRKASQKIENEIADFNTNVNELWGNLVLTSLDDYNKVRQQAQEFVVATRNQIQAHYEEKSEKWQQSEKGEVYQQWIDLWSEVEAELAEINLTVQVETQELEFPSAIYELPREAD